MKRRILATGVACLAAVLVSPATASAAPTGSADSGSAQVANNYIQILPHLAEAAINCLITGTPLQQCGYTGIDPAPLPLPQN
ncbi:MULTISPECIES: hypothetical protein [unclassified Rhodococcus (in: high G+C Gram-positive bacteria)]|uniref:hypothetical protein n=1 Tax=unclassified Rhodococcus (in: high G+C Gram-positive bacteria) TaxID=192944 RepID=UPI001C58E164|nr:MULTISPECIES: hypothetical protein [unclassified Rhodococcus (in: high G+C Gram-positive bacteria)]QXU53364.1 hypothetical protein KXC42_21870 [Rhodococcus sp. LW-XY12]